ncbi:MAG: DNA adenine methylase [Brevinema sp.]
MRISPSPLRYPGGKSSTFPMVSDIILSNDLQGCHYIEPYAGGSGLALLLLFKGIVSEIHLNDLDRSIWAFWNNVLNHKDAFIETIIATDVTIEEWHRQREIQLKKEIVDSFDLGFSSFFLNRTNRSGIILKAGMIGGYKQNGNYKLDCRFNKNNLISKINKIA